MLHQMFSQEFFLVKGKLLKSLLCFKGRISQILPEVNVKSLFNLLLREFLEKLCINWFINI